MSKIYYMAGLVDGEGSITLSHSSNAQYRAPSLSVASTTYELVEWCKNNFGGYISTKRSKAKEHHKVAYQWRLAKIDKLIEVLTELQPLLLEPDKSRRAKLIIDEYKSVTPRNGKYSESMHEAKMDFERRFYEGGAAMAKPLYCKGCGEEIYPVTFGDLRYQLCSECSKKQV